MAARNNVVQLRNVTIDVVYTGDLIEAVEALSHAAFARVEKFADDLRPRVEASTSPVRGSVGVRIIVKPELRQIIESGDFFDIEITDPSGLLSKL